MAQSSDSATRVDLVPPDERFWQRYSPHHEAILSAVGSLTLHGLVIGIPILFIAVLGILGAGSAEMQPPKMDVVQLVGTGGDGMEGGGDVSPLGSADGANQKEAVEQKNETLIPAAEADSKLNDLPNPVPTVVEPAVTEEPKSLEDLSAELNRIGKEATKLQEPPPAPKAVRKTSTRPAGVATGQAGGTGLGGSGGGSGTGKGKGKGDGSGGLPGRAMTKQEVFAQRWRFDLSGNGKEHADKLTAAGVILVVHNRFNHAFVIKDLRRRPLEADQGYPVQFKDAVKWYNRSRQSIALLGQHLSINPDLISQLELLLPKEREEKMAEAEAAFARKQGRAMNQVTETWFDFRLVNGSFEPVVIRQN